MSGDSYYSYDHGHDEVHMTTAELITKHGYVAETHHVWTEDGYRLELHRVVRKANGKSNKNTNTDKNLIIEEELNNLNNVDSSNNSQKKKIPVLVNHGLLSSSADFVLLGPQKSLAYLLSNAGYDVWLANVRGNTYSQCHKQYTTKDKEFWDFSWHEIGCYDLPAIIDYVLERTHQPKLYYVGYSQGTTTFYVMLSERPEYNEKVIAMVSLAPVAFLSNQRSPLIKFIVRFYTLMEWGSAYCNIHNWFPRSNRLQAKALGTIIRNTPGTLTKVFCNSWFYLVAGFGSNQLDKSMLPVIFGHFPAGSSAKQIIHYSQVILTDSFRKFDYGTTKNLKLYGSTRPPNYCLERVKVPVTIFYSENDFLTHPDDVQRLVEKLPNVKKYKIEYSKFNHIDYLWGRDANTLLYEKIVNVLKYQHP